MDSFKRVFRYFGEAGCETPAFLDRFWLAMALKRVAMCQYKAAFFSNNLMNTTNNNLMTNEMRAYLAGLFDGEGSVNIFKQSRKGMAYPAYFVEISIGNTHKGVLQ